jgi:hypothetical protein
VGTLPVNDNAAMLGDFKLFVTRAGVGLVKASEPTAGTRLGEATVINRLGATVVNAKAFVPDLKSGENIST